MTSKTTIGVSWSAKFAVPNAHLMLFEPAFEGLSGIVSMFEDPAFHETDDTSGDVPWWIEGLFADAPPRAEIAARLAVIAQAEGLPEPELIIARIPSKDWLKENVASFKPLTAGRYYVHGDHIRGPFPAGKKRLQINAATAFGSGEHASTFGCLRALDALARRMSVAAHLATLKRPALLDMGCGSGILALAMAKTWPGHILAADIDPEAVRVTNYNAAANGVASRLKALVTDGCGARDVRDHAPYGIITANILARPLRAMSRDLSRLLAPGGYLIMAGLLIKQEPMVLNAYRAQGLRLVQRFARAPWTTLLLKR